jgi:hypothetical protein
MTPKQQDQFFRELLSNDAVEQIRQHSLATMLRAAQRRRVRRKLGAASALACLALVSAWLLVPGSDENIVISQTPRTSPSATANRSTPPVRQISDAELLALFPGQTVALIGPPGNQQFLVLGEAPVTR